MSAPAIPLDLSRPFTRSAALAAGITDGQLKGDAFVRIFRGVHRHRSCPETAVVLVQAALLVHPGDAYASRGSAARVYGLPVTTTPGEHITVGHPDDRRRRDHFRHHLAGPHDDVRVVDGVCVSGPEQLFCELAEELSLVDLVVAGDALVRWHGTSPDRLEKAAVEAPRRVRPLARRAAALVRAQVDSPMETRVRLLIVLAGLPEPVVNFKICWPDGRVRFRFDLCYPRHKLVVEYDGQQHRSDLDQWDTDISRREWMDTNGWTLVVVVARGVYRRPDETLERIHSALRRSGGRVPKRRSDEWRRHFPVR